MHMCVAVHVYDVCVRADRIRVYVYVCDVTGCAHVHVHVYTSTRVYMYTCMYTDLPMY